MTSLAPWYRAMNTLLVADFDVQFWDARTIIPHHDVFGIPCPGVCAPAIATMVSSVSYYIDRLTAEEGNQFYVPSLPGPFYTAKIRSPCPSISEGSVRDNTGCVATLQGSGLVKGKWKVKSSVDEEQWVFRKLSSFLEGWKHSFINHFCAAEHSKGWSLQPSLKQLTLARNSPLAKITAEPLHGTAAFTIPHREAWAFVSLTITANLDFSL